MSDVRIGTLIDHRVSGPGMVIHAGRNEHDQPTDPLVAWDDADIPPRRVDPTQFTVTGYDAEVNHVLHAPGTTRHGKRAKSVRVTAPYVHQ